MRAEPTRAPRILAWNGVSYRCEPTGAARRARSLLPRLAARGWHPLLFLSRSSLPAFAELAHRGVELFPVPAPHGGGPLRSFLSQGRILKTMKERGCDILCAETLPIPDGPRTLFTVHDLRAWEAPRWTPLARRLWIRAQLPRALPRASAVIAVSHCTAEGLARCFPGTEATVIRNGADALADPGSAASPFPLDDLLEPYLLAIGPWDRRKDLPTLFRAHAALRHTPTLLLAGRPGVRLPRGVRYFLPGDRGLAWLMKHAQAVIFPSRYEGFDLPLAEASFLGASVIASDIPAHRELLGSPSPLLFTPGDPRDLIRALRALPHHDPLPPVALPTWDAAADRLVQLLESRRARSTSGSAETHSGETAEPADE